MDFVGKKGREEWGGKLNEVAGTGGLSGFGKKFMMKFGWKEGQGLGKNEDGMVEHVKVKQRQESAGLGIEEHDRQKVNESWWFNSFEQALQSFRTVDDESDDGKSSKKKKKKKKDKKERKKQLKSGTTQGEGETMDGLNLPSYDDLFKATGGKRLGMRARASQKAKWERTEVVAIHQEQTGDKMESDLIVKVDEEVMIESQGSDGDGVADRKKDKSKKKSKKEKQEEEEEEEQPPIVAEMGKKKKKKRSRGEEEQEEGESAEEQADEEKKKKKDSKIKKTKKRKSIEEPEPEAELEEAPAEEESKKSSKKKKKKDR